MHNRRGSRRDVSGYVDLSDTRAVIAAIRAIFTDRFPRVDWSPLEQLGSLFETLYRGEHPDYLGCEAGYHDAGHVRDVTLTLARLFAGRELRWPAFSLGPRLALAGTAAALLHDSGYLRRRGDHRVTTGAAYTRHHVGRGARLARAMLPAIGLGDIAPLSARLIHFTNCTLAPASLRVADEQERALGGLLGTADLLAQIAERDYLDRCYYQLYDEFEASGYTGKDGYICADVAAYRSREDLLRRTPLFIQEVARPRLERDFAGAYHYASVFFGGPNPYLDAIRDNCLELERRIGGPDAAAVGA